MIVVTAAGGRTGTAVVRALPDRAEQVRAVVSRCGPRPELAALGAEVVRLVDHSVLRPQARAMPHHAAKDRAEEALDVSGVPWRVLQPGAYAGNLDDQLPEVARTGVLGSPWGLRTGQSLVDLRDVADAAAVLLTEDGLDGGTFEAVGPEPLTARDLAGLIGAHLAREVRAEDVVPQGAVPSAYAGRCRRTMFDHYRAHGFTGSPRVLSALLGRAPRTYAEHLAGLPADGRPVEGRPG